MSLTLRDAQHLSFKTFKKLEAFDEKSSSSIGNLASLARKANEIQSVTVLEDLKKKEETGRMLAELFFSAFVLAEKQGISLEEVFLQTVDEIILGFVS